MNKSSLKWLSNDITISVLCTFYFCILYAYSIIISSFSSSSCSSICSRIYDFAEMGVYVIAIYFHPHWEVFFNISEKQSRFFCYVSFAFPLHPISSVILALLWTEFTDYCSKISSYQAALFFRNDKFHFFITFFFKNLMIFFENLIENFTIFLIKLLLFYYLNMF